MPNPTMTPAGAFPITLEQAAERLHIRNVRWLRAQAKRIGCGRRVPGTIIFDGNYTLNSRSH